jgi:hypothetical protein
MCTPLQGHDLVFARLLVGGARQNHDIEHFMKRILGTDDEKGDEQINEQMEIQ